MSAARFNAALMLRGLASFRPAMSNAVPWSGAVRTMGNPSVTFTPSSQASSLSGMSA